jgi:ribosomal protein L24E
VVFLCPQYRNNFKGKEITPGTQRAGTFFVERENEVFLLNNHKALSAASKTHTHTAQPQGSPPSRSLFRTTEKETLLGLLGQSGAE